MGKASKQKGNRFELATAKMLNSVFDNYNIRRVPQSGALDIKSDIYCPENDSFPFFIECKYREEYRWSTICDGRSTLFKVMERTSLLASESYVAKKYQTPQTPIVIFKGGDFKEPMVMFDINNNGGIRAGNLCPVLKCWHEKLVMRLNDFVKVCSKKPLKLRTKILQEDDGEY